MPTRDGDIVITHPGTSKAMHAVWRVAAEGQQACGGQTDGASIAIGRTAALTLAKLMARESRGAIFFLDTESGAWSSLD